jgi:hypothetical protein
MILKAEWGSIWKESVVAYFWYKAEVLLDILRKATTNISQDNR